MHGRKNKILLLGIFFTIRGLAEIILFYQCFEPYSYIISDII